MTKQKQIDPRDLKKLREQIKIGSIDPTFFDLLCKREYDPTEGHLAPIVVTGYEIYCDEDERTVDCTDRVGSLRVLSPKGVTDLSFYGNGEVIAHDDVSKYFEGFKGEEFILWEGTKYINMVSGPTYKECSELYTKDFRRIPSRVGRGFSLGNLEHVCKNASGDKSFTFDSDMNWKPKEVYALIEEAYGDKQ